MNGLEEKIKKIKMGLFLCNEIGNIGSCDSCPYNDNASYNCKLALYTDTVNVIDSLSNPSNKKMQRKAPEIAKRFIILTRWTDSRTIAVNVDAIRHIEDTSSHTESLIYFKEAREPRDESILVKETIIDILEKISEGKSE